MWTVGFRATHTSDGWGGLMAPSAVARATGWNPVASRSLNGACPIHPGSDNSVPRYLTLGPPPKKTRVADSRIPSHRPQRTTLSVTRMTLSDFGHPTSTLRPVPVHHTGHAVRPSHRAEPAKRRALLSTPPKPPLKPLPLKPRLPQSNLPHGPGPLAWTRRHLAAGTEQASPHGRGLRRTGCIRSPAV